MHCSSVDLHIYIIQAGTTMPFEISEHACPVTWCQLCLLQHSFVILCSVTLPYEHLIGAGWIARYEIYRIREVTLSRPET
jgi:hypothetical protein